MCGQVKTHHAVLQSRYHQFSVNVWAGIVEVLWNSYKEGRDFWQSTLLCVDMGEQYVRHVLLWYIRNNLTIC
jgi:hypothetical protein